MRKLGPQDTPRREVHRWTGAGAHGRRPGRDMHPCCSDGNLQRPFVRQGAHQRGLCIGSLGWCVWMGWSSGREGLAGGHSPGATEGRCFQWHDGAATVGVCMSQRGQDTVIAQETVPQRVRGTPAWDGSRSSRGGWQRGQEDLAGVLWEGPSSRPREASSGQWLH